MSVRLSPPESSTSGPAPTPGPTDPMTPRAAGLWAALAGIVSMAAFLAAAEVVALVTGPTGSPLFAVGSAVVDLAPAGVKDAMVSLFGTGDKVALFVLMGVLLVVITGAAGYGEYRRQPIGKIAFVAGGALAVIAVLTRADAGQVDAIPSLVGTFAAVLLVDKLASRLRRWVRSTSAGWAEQTQPVPPLRGPGLERRSFLTYTVVAGVAAVVVGTGARVVNAGRANAAALRRALTLPRASVTEAAVPAGASLDVEGITPYVTPAADFYRIDTALQVPSIDPADWSLRIHGLVDREVTISFDELLALPLEEHMATLSCVSNDVGGDLIGNALWLGYPIRSLLERAGPNGGADMVLSRSIDGFSAGTPLDVLQDDGTDALLAVGMNGQPLPIEHGFPVRMVVPGLFGYVSATKWVVEMEVTRFSDAQGYWTPRGWDALGPVKLESRIDVPRDGASVDAGTVSIAGVAWQPHTGVEAVQVRIDGGSWVDATLADSVSADTWRQWVHRWDAGAAGSGSHTIDVRAQGADGTWQREQYVQPAPNGAEGWHRVTVEVA